MSLGHFRCAMRLMKIECLLQSENYPLVETLIMIYEVFTSPKRRLIIVAHIILHYFCENNPEKVMHYLKLYMDQNIDDNLKKYHLIVSNYYVHILNNYFSFVCQFFSFTMDYFKIC